MIAVDDDTDARLGRLEMLVDREFDRRDQLMRMWRARYYLRRAFTQGPWRLPARLRWSGMAREIDGRFLMRTNPSTKDLVFWGRAARASAPLGWRWEIMCDRDAVLLMPAWLYYPRRWWLRARCSARCWYWGLLNKHLPVRGKR